LEMSSDTPQDLQKQEKFDRVGYLTEEQFWAPIEDEYVAKLAATTPEDIFPSPNPGPSNPDGTVNFECHCVGHLVASPCGFEFREAISCQKAATSDEDDARCAEQLMRFMDCAIRTQCFKKNKDTEDKDD
ncbi:hypothetical protein PMAYCL1PPCAC_00143, partial [Pristionchus mayeri]